MTAVEKIRQWKLEGKNQREIAQKLEISESQVSRWLCGRQKPGRLWSEKLEQM